MMRDKYIFALGLLIPFISLAGLVMNYQYDLSTAQEVILPLHLTMHGYQDERNSMQGNFFKYEIDYGIKDICTYSENYIPQPSYICLEPKSFSYNKPNECKKLILGFCQSAKFYAGIERFYIPESKIEKFKNIEKNQNMQVILAITHAGHAYVKSLLIDEKPWDE